MEGIELRDYFAGQALTGLIANPSFDGNKVTPEQIAGLSYLAADVMIQTREMIHKQEAESQSVEGA